MKTEESKLKASFTKEMPANSGTTTSNCTVKVPILVHSSPKPPNRPYVYQAKVPKPKAMQSNCTNINNPWIVRSAIAFVAVIVIVVFASLQGKTSADLQNTKDKLLELETLVESLRKNIDRLETRVQCVMSDNGTDGRGKPCPGGTGGKIGYLKNRQKEDRTNSTTQKPTQKPTRNRGATTSNSQLSSQTSSRTTKRRQSTMYTYWGSSKCPTFPDVKTIYSGRVASLHSRANPAVGSDYLCIPDRFEYTDNKNMTSGLYLSPVKYGANMTVFTAITAEMCKLWGESCESWKKKKPRMFRILDYQQVPCAVCRHERHSATLVTPGRNMCHPGMRREYYGYLMTGQHGSARSQHICVGADADGIPGSNTTRGQGPFLQPVAYKCDEPSCPQNLESAGNKAKAITCVVCSV
ncbi:uncharacterized protein LOC144656512 isoform X2 [Oculina patagonica]